MRRIIRVNVRLIECRLQALLPSPHHPGRRRSRRGWSTVFCLYGRHRPGSFISGDAVSTWRDGQSARRTLLEALLLLLLALSLLLRREGRSGRLLHGDGRHARGGRARSPAVPARGRTCGARRAPARTDRRNRRSAMIATALMRTPKNVAILAKIFMPPRYEDCGECQKGSAGRCASRGPHREIHCSLSVACGWSFLITRASTQPTEAANRLKNRRCEHHRCPGATWSAYPFRGLESAAPRLPIHANDGHLCTVLATLGFISVRSPSRRVAANKQQRGDHANSDCAWGSWIHGDDVCSSPRVGVDNHARPDTG